MADYYEQQNGKGGAKPQNTTDDQSSSETSNTTSHGDTYDSCGCTGHNQSRKTFHPWEPETWECESDTMDGASCRDNSCGDEGASRDSAPSELDEFQARTDETLPPAPTGPRPGAADNRERYEDLVRSQQPDGSEETSTPAVEARETGTGEPMQWTLVDLGYKSC